MKFIFPLISLFLFGCINNDNDAKNNTDIALKSKMDSVSYSLGFMYAQQLKAGYQQMGIQEPTINIDILKKSLISNLDPSHLSLIDSSLAVNIMNEYELNRHRNMHQAVIVEGEKFLNENSQREGVIVTATGLQYEVIEQGGGNKPSITDMVEIHYTGYFINGNVFDSSVERNETLSIGVNEVIRGWREALQLMSVGSKWKIYVPYQIGYGELGTQNGPIGPYSTLIFEIELLNIK
jgi:FKBP-type peptidyl-prolyl cis-trans isomerase FklB